MRKLCYFVAGEDSCQATPILRCNFCGNNKGAPCGQEGASRSVVTAHLAGTLTPRLTSLAIELLAEGVQPFPAREQKA